MVKELTSFWTLISKKKFLHEIIKTLTDWISENCESPMVLLVSHTGMETMSSADFQQNLKLLETCVELYFKRLLFKLFFDYFFRNSFLRMGRNLTLDKCSRKKQRIIIRDPKVSTFIKI